MTKAVQVKGGTEQGIREVLKFLLEKHKVEGVFTLKKLNNEGAVAYSLITTVNELDDAVPLYPLMPTNAGKLLSRFTLEGSPTKPMVAVIKPCELRAFVELVKREQGSFENLFIMSPTCGGVYPLKMAPDCTVEKNLKNYWGAIKKGEIPADVRTACKACTEFVPYTADITIDVVGNSGLDKQCVLYLNNKSGEELVNGIKADSLTKDLESKTVNALRDKREKEQKTVFSDIAEKTKDLDGLIDLFGRCIGCHGCSKVCPICYCKLCEFESPDAEYRPSNYESELKRRGGLKVPPGTLYYQIGRLTHVGISCVGCGSCEDVCPVDIPLSSLFKKVGGSVQKLFEYVPGKNVEEEIPLVTFKEQEFAEVEE